MSLEGNVWNKNNSDWRQLTDSATVVWTYPSADQAVASVADGSLSLAKFANVTSDRLIGRDTAGSGAPEEISLSTGLEFSGSQSIRLANTAVTPGTYSNTTFTVDAQGRITSVSTGSTPGLIHLVTGTASTTTATLDIVLTSYTAYKTLLFVLREVRPLTDDVQLYMRFSTDGGGGPSNGGEGGGQNATCPGSGGGGGGGCPTTGTGGRGGHGGPGLVLMITW